MNKIIKIGQKWSSINEPELGSGLVIKNTNKQITIFFNNAKENRIYSSENAPIIRIKFLENEIIEHKDFNKCIIKEATEEEEIYKYQAIREETGEIVTISETDIISNANLKNPIYIIQKNNVAKQKTYELRREAIKIKRQISQSKNLGSLGVKIDLIPHQMFIANEVSNRFNPRVLLADEVGLGKTIEAGLIIYRQLINHRIQKVLIVVPESLSYQWFVEMYRKFNLKFSIFEQDLTTGYTDNPFDAEQLFIINTKQIKKPEIFDAISKSNWDMLVVDEAHNLSYAEDKKNTEYEIIKTLANQIKSVILLTATPDQLGYKSHFLRLKILDNIKFCDYDKFVQDKEKFSEISQLSNKILSEEECDTATKEEILKLIGENQTINIDNFNANKEEIINRLIDYHGTSRILFRNSRKHIDGFPTRKLVRHPITDIPKEYNYIFNNKSTEDIELQVTSQLNPETVFYDENQQWWEFDRRIPWLMNLLSSNPEKKYLLICASQYISNSLDATLKRTNIKSANFDESMSILRRDQASAYFAEEDGAQVLICSEIGSEGRNFQFVSDLICFDIPINHDLLEQRIGRLDRIGQTKEISIHVPYYDNTGQTILVNWYQDILNAFNKTCSIGNTVYKNFAKHLIHAIAKNEDIPTNIREEIKQYISKLKTELEKGRDKMLEISSSGIYSNIQTIIDDIKEKEEINTIKSFALRMWDKMGIDITEIDNKVWKLAAGKRMNFPYMDITAEESKLVTFDRKTAIMRHDVLFVTEEHSLIQHGIDVILENGIGVITVEVLKNSDIKTGSLFIKANFICENISPKNKFFNRYLPHENLSITVNKEGKDVSEEFYEIYQNSVINKEDKGLNRKIAKLVNNNVMEIIKETEKELNSKLDKIKNEKIKEAKKELDVELKRLNYLSKKNNNINEKEILVIEEKIKESEKYIQDSKIKLDSIKIMTFINS